MHSSWLNRYPRGFHQNIQFKTVKFTCNEKLEREKKKINTQNYFEWNCVSIDDKLIEMLQRGNLKRFFKNQRNEVNDKMWIFIRKGYEFVAFDCIFSQRESKVRGSFLMATQMMKWRKQQHQYCGTKKRHRSKGKTCEPEAREGQWLEINIRINFNWLENLLCDKNVEWANGALRTAALALAFAFTVTPIAN